MSTVGRDLFQEGSNTALALHTPNVGATWTLEVAQFTVLSSMNRVRHNRNALDRARKGDDIGDDNMDVSAMVSVTATAARIAGVCARMSTDSFANQYEAYLQWKNTTTQDVFLFKNLGGTRTQIGTGTCALAEGVEGDLRLSVRSGTQDVYVNGVLIIAGTEPDSTLSGRQYVGIIMNGNNGANATLADFLSETVSAPADLAGAITASATLAGALTTAILLVGLLTGTATVAANLTAGPVPVAGSGGARDPLISPNRAPGQSPGWPGLSRLRSMRPRLESFAPVIADWSCEVTGTATVAGTLTTGIPLSGSLDGIATVVADLTAGPALDAAITATATLTGTLTTQIQLAGGLTGTATVAANLSGPVALEATVSGSATLTAFFMVPPPDIPLLAPDRQDTWAPVWVFEGAAWPVLYATRDVDVFTAQAYARIIGEPVITRRIVENGVLGRAVEVQDVSVTFANADGALSGDYRAAPFTLSRYDAATGVLLLEWTGLVSHTSRGRGTFEIDGTNIDLAILEEKIPEGVIDTTTFPLALDIGVTPAWVFGNVVNLPLPCVRDDQVNSEFDYVLCRGTAAALTGARRVTPGGANPFIDMGFIELEPYPGMDGVLVNGTMEDWDAGAAVAPDGWTLSGTGTVAKDIVAADVSEGGASASVVATGANARLTQDCMLNVPDLPLSWWRGREISVTVDIKTATAANAFLRMSDGIAAIDSPFHTGGGAYETLTVGTVAVPFVFDAAATIASIQLRQVGAGTAQFDNVRFYLMPKSWAECLRPELYPGYTAIRTFLRQEAATSGELYQLVADVHGLQPERNPARAIRTMLSDPTHGLGRAVDAASFDAAEAAMCLTHEAAVLLDGPELFLPFRDAIDSFTAQTVTVRDRSGHERHGTYDKGASGQIDIVTQVSGGNDAFVTNSVAGAQWVEVPSDPAFSSQSISVRVSLKLSSGSLPDTAPYPIVEKLVGATAQSGYMVYRQSNLLVWAVRGVNAVLYSVTSPLVDVTDEGRWIDVVGTANGGVLRLFRDGVLAATGSYTGEIAEGEGAVLVGKFGSGGIIVGVGRDAYDNIEIVSHALSAGRVAALNAALPLNAESIFGYDYETAVIASPTPEFYYKLDDSTGSTIMSDDQGDNGTWVGGPALGVSGPLNRERGIINSFTAAHFKNNVAKYGVSTGRTLADAAGALSVFYRPLAKKATAGIVEKTIGGVRDTQWGLCQRGAVVRFTLKAANGVNTIDAPVLPEDVLRWNWFRATWSAGTIQLYKNGTLAASGTYTAPLTTGVGDFYVGVQGTAGSGLTRPGRGDIGRVSYHPAAFTAADVTRIWTAATWYNGGLYVDAALTEARPAQDWLRQAMQLRGARLGFTVAGAITCSVDAAAPTTMRLEARDGAGDGERTLLDSSDRQRPSLDDAVRDVVVNFRRDLLSGAYLGRLRRQVSTRLDAQGKRIGRKRIFNLDTVREYPAADRFACYMAARLLLDETVKVRLTLEARQLVEGDLVMVTDASMGYTGQTLEVQEVEKELTEIGAVLREWDEDLYLYAPNGFPANAGPG